VNDMKMAYFYWLQRNFKIFYSFCIKL